MHFYHRKLSEHQCNMIIFAHKAGYSFVHISEHFEQLKENPQFKVTVSYLLYGCQGHRTMYNTRSLKITASTRQKEVIKMAAAHGDICCHVMSFHCVFPP